MAILKPNKSTLLSSDLNINEFLLTKNNPNNISIPVKRTANQSLIGVTLHNTDWLNVSTETTPAEQYVRATYNGNMGDTRVHYYVDDKCAWRTLSDDYTSWHAATGAQGQGNCNTISIESIMRNQTDDVSVASMKNTAKLIAWIFGQYGWTVEKNLYTHNYWTNYKETGALSSDLTAQSLKKCTSATANPNGKYCPVYILPQWEKFKALVQKYMGVSQNSTITSATKKSNEEIAKEVFAGKWGNGDERKKKLTNAGYDYNAIQNIINRLVSSNSTFKPYSVKITASNLNIRKTPRVESNNVVGNIRTKGVYTIVEESTGAGSTKGWGKLKSGAGWISLDHVVKV